MFLLDSLMISGIRWALETTLTAAEAEMNDDGVLREQLLEAELRREMGEISDEEFETLEGDLLTRIREIKERREGSADAFAFSARSLQDAEGGFQVEAGLTGDFHRQPGTAAETHVVAVTPDAVQEVVVTDPPATVLPHRRATTAAATARSRPTSKARAVSTRRTASRRSTK